MKIDRLQIMSSFWLKILAIIFMTVDHIGLFMEMYMTPASGTTLYFVILSLRCIGRLAFPLFIFLLIEGIYHTKDIWKYITRIGIVMVAIIIVSAIINYCYDNSLVISNAFIDLFVIALFFAFLKQKGLRKIIAIAPLAYIILCTIVTNLEIAYKFTANWLPSFIRTPYGIFGLVIALGFYYARPLADHFSKEYAVALNVDMETFRKLPYYQSLINVTCILVLLISNILFWLLYTMNSSLTAFIFDMGIETWSILAGLLFLFYNGKRGYDKSWFKYGCYMYYPLHIIILFVIFQLVYIGQLF